jgi:hypothetical protein
MWHWDQGRMAYFQYDVLRKVAHFVTENTWARDKSTLICNETGLALVTREMSAKPAIDRLKKE